jgi:hypothetical protein
MHYCTQDLLYAQVGGRAAVRCAPVEVWHRRPDFFALGPWTDATLDSFDCIWMRKDPPVDRDYLHATYLLDHAGPSTRVLNRPAALRDANEKLYALHFSRVHSRDDRDARRGPHPGLAREARRSRSS